MNDSFKAKLIAAGLTAALPLVMFFEGLVTQTYVDPVGIPTACYGYTGKDLLAGQKFTEGQCQDLLADKLLEANQAIDGCVAVPLTDNQRSAFVSFAYNVGGGAFCRSTMARKLNTRDFHGACDELLRWTYAGGKQLPGLVKRRQAEHSLCLKGPV